MGLIPLYFALHLSYVVIKVHHIGIPIKSLVHISHTCGYDIITSHDHSCNIITVTTFPSPTRVISARLLLEAWSDISRKEVGFYKGWDEWSQWRKAPLIKITPNSFQLQRFFPLCARIMDNDKIKLIWFYSHVACGFRPNKICFKRIGWNVDSCASHF